MSPPRVHTLANGVRVVCDPIPSLQTLALSVVAGRGARFEDEARSGWSHLLEHMVFKGAGARSARDIVEAIEAGGGHINAATGYARTSYQVRALAGGLDLGMAVISDLLLRPVLSADELEREKQVIAQEIAEAADTPDDLIFDLAQETAYAGQPLGRPILGTVESIGRADPAALADWRARLYGAESLVISASGAVDGDELVASAERWFGDAQPSPEPAIAPAAVFTGGVRATAKRLEQAHLVFQLPSVGARHPDYFALRLFAELLGGGMASRLFQEAREKRGLAYAIDAYADTYEETGLLGVYAGCAAGDAAELAQVTAGEIRGLAGRVEDAELARGKAQLKASMFMAREQPLSRAEQAAAQVLMFDGPLDPARLAEQIEAVTPADLARLGAAMLEPGRAVAAVLGPKSAMKAAEKFERALFA